MSEDQTADGRPGDTIAPGGDWSTADQAAADAALAAWRARYGGLLPSQIPGLPQSPYVARWTRPAAARRSSLIGMHPICKTCLH
jgi:hypothetical protein